MLPLLAQVTDRPSTSEFHTMSSSVGLACRSQRLAFCRGRDPVLPVRRTQLAHAGKKWDDVATEMIDKYMNTGSGGSAATKAPLRKTQTRGLGVGNGVILLLVANYVIFALSQLTNLPLVSSLPLYTSNTHWWSFITYAFCHADFNHLANNMFMLLVFGRSVEEDEGFFGVLATYIICGLGSAAAFFITSSPRAALVGASGSVFGLFVVSVLSKLSQFNLRRLVEILAMAPFVYGQITSNAAMQLSGAASSVSYIAHLGGATTGFLLVALLALLPSDP
eukprot:jgi/Ulvmu1/12907/UM098_0095.1